MHCDHSVFLFFLAFGLDDFGLGDRLGGAASVVGSAAAPRTTTWTMSRSSASASTVTPCGKVRSRT